MTGTFECMKQPFFLVAESKGLHARACPHVIRHENPEAIEEQDHCLNPF
jgi:hypothetical protein